MARRRDGNKTYRSGDPIHIVVTQDFVDNANHFFSYCRDRGYNPSQIIRQAMVEWLSYEESGTPRTPIPKPSNGNGNGSSMNDFDEKLMNLIQERPAFTHKKGMSLKTVKELLDGY